MNARYCVTFAEASAKCAESQDNSEVKIIVTAVQQLTSAASFSEFFPLFKGCYSPVSG